MSDLKTFMGEGQHEDENYDSFIKSTSMIKPLHLDFNFGEWKNVRLIILPIHTQRTLGELLT